MTRCTYLLKGKYTKPQVKVIEYHAEGEKDPKVVHAQYQSIAQEHTRTMEELIVEQNVNP